MQDKDFFKWSASPQFWFSARITQQINWVPADLGRGEQTQESGWTKAMSMQSEKQHV